MTSPKTIRKHPKYVEFFSEISDRTVIGAISSRIDRLSLGNAGDHAPVGAGVYELRIHLGAGWRVYYAHVGNQIILLLGGGMKKGQQSDIEAAQARLDEFRK
jgi:putative addiction module killer protein